MFDTWKGYQTGEESFRSHRGVPLGYLLCSCYREAHTYQQRCHTSINNLLSLGGFLAATYIMKASRYPSIIHTIIYNISPLLCPYFAIIFTFGWCTSHKHSAHFSSCAGWRCYGSSVCVLQCVTLVVVLVCCGTTMIRHVETCVPKHSGDERRAPHAADRGDGTRSGISGQVL